jgi:lycopene beta-cyclase
LVKTESQSFSCTTLFNSIYNPSLASNQTKYPLLQQHFVGWFIKTETPVFNPELATFMDFSVEQKGNTRFMYILPTSPTEALLEYTLFSKELLSKDEYEAEIEKYLQQLGITHYTIVEKEMGTIPMTSYPFWKHNTKNVINIGTAGGWTKASTGFTFKNADKKSSELVSFMETHTDGRMFHSKTKFWWYDLLLLDILDQKNETGSAIFSALFEKGNAPLILKFLDEETSFWEDLQVIWKCPKSIFIQALIGRLFRL